MATEDTDPEPTEPESTEPTDAEPVEAESTFVGVADADELREQGRMVARAGNRALALFHHEGEFRAVANRCPHMGFPLSEGTVDDGVLTCHWHHARFELSCGDTFDPWADDVQTFPTEVRDGEVYVDPHPDPDLPPVEHWTDRLETGLEEGLRLVVAKSVLGLADEDVPYTDPLRQGLAFGARYRADGWGRGLTTLAVMANLHDEVRPEDRTRALYAGLSEVAENAQGEPPRFEQPAFSTRDLTRDRLESWFRETVEVRDDDGAERCLRTAIETLDPEAVADILYTAATDHLYMDAGHTFDFVNKACEALDHVGWEHAPEILPSVIPRLTGATRYEERSAWRQPLDVAGLVFDAYDELPGLVEDGADETWSAPEGFADTLLSDDPEELVTAMKAAIQNGATPAEIAGEVAHAAGVRVARFGTSNEFGDWDTVHHTYTYANAVHEAALRTDSTAAYRGAFAGAMSVYLDRFLNTPPTPIPDGSEVETPDDLRTELLGLFDEEGEVDSAGRLVAAFLADGGDPAELKRALGEGLLREDADFHTRQNVEAAFEQFDLADDPERARVHLVATARYLSAHAPTRRSAEQTYTIADRLNRGENIHESD
ncbi:Rieske (2Fe-2S) protein (plasmid) [Halorussus salilacus]|uniref:Rieske (2Fe-2S) protein n=1 Tax=Halorussus salilacus TaxID=2953750 RepID=UPI00209FDE60|nr:Rieske (2Fe-2S) protein [Halorussus salilacus]USZ69710.1 Rieske (2Fe-2S) protein [Halorussus salilacus]